MFIMEMKYLLIRNTIMRRFRSDTIINSLFSLVILQPAIPSRLSRPEKYVSFSLGIATQTILTIPVSHVTNNQMVNLALSNGQVVSTTLANLQSLAQPQNMLNTPTSNGKFNVNLFTRLRRCNYKRFDARN